jgi:hypothetical protein
MSSAEVFLLSGSLLRHCETKSWKSGDHFLPLSVGAYLVTIR